METTNNDVKEQLLQKLQTYLTAMLNSASVSTMTFLDL